jgi:hypothetical protein
VPKLLSTPGQDLPYSLPGSTAGGSVRRGFLLPAGRWLAWSIRWPRSFRIIVTLCRSLILRRTSCVPASSPLPAAYPDADDRNDLRKNPALKLACRRPPESGDDLASQPTMSRFENAPNWPRIGPHGRHHGGRVAHEPMPWSKGITLDIDDTAGTGHDHQQLFPLAAHYDERRLLPVHVCDRTPITAS